MITLENMVKVISDVLESMVEEAYVEEVLSTLIQYLKNEFKATSCAIVLFGERIQVKISRGLSYTYIKELQRMTSHPLIDYIKKENRFTVIDEDHPLYPNGFEHSYKTLVLVPVSKKGESMGLLFINLPEKVEFSETEKRFLESVGYLISIGLDYYEMREKLMDIINIDTLTGVYNYKHFHELLYREVLRTTETGHPFALALIAITGIKEFNEHFGHVKGDELLKDVAKFLKENVRRFDAIARYGGAKFVIIFPEATKEDAKKMLENILSKFEETQWAKMNPRVYLDIGLVAFPEDADNEKLLLARLEECVHEAKRVKGNDIITWPFK